MLRSKFTCLLLSLVAFTLASNAYAKDSSSAEVPAPAKETKATDEKPGSLIDVELVGYKEADKEQGAVIAALQNLLQGLAHRNIDQISACLSDDVTVMDSKTKDFVYGKEAVIQQVKKNMLGTDETQHPVKRLVVYNPFVNVKGDAAMVSFRATKDLADKNSTKLESWCSEVFERKNGKWLVLQLKTDWEPAKSKSEK